MLVLSRKVGEKILIGDSISVTVVRISGGGVRIGIDAPADLPVVREELSTNKHSQEKPGDQPSVVHHQDSNPNNGNPVEGNRPNNPR